MSNKLFDPKKFTIRIDSTKGMKVNKDAPASVVLNILLSYASQIARQMELKDDALLNVAQNWVATVDPHTIFPSREELAPEIAEIEKKELAQPTANPNWKKDIEEAKKTLRFAKEE